MNNPFKEDKVAKARGEAEEFYQIKEKMGELWITYNGAPIIPESLLKESALETLKKVRELYVKSKNVLQDAEA
jgi:hypothetical protein